MSVKIKNLNKKIQEVDNSFDCLLGVEITTEEDKVTELEYKLYTDSVLGCKNRAYFEEKIKDLGESYTVFSVDANNLKYINDSVSHEAGDILLKVIADAGMKVWSDCFARQGGDEFSVLIRGTSQSSDLSDKQLKQFLDLVAEEDKKHPELPISVAIGYANGDKTSDFKEVLIEADKNMYLMKEAYKKAHPQYDMRKAKLSEDSLKEAITNGTFREVITKYRKEKAKETGDDVFSSVVETDMVFEEGVSDVVEPFEKSKEPDTSLVPVTDEDMSSLNISSAEEDYQANEFNNKVTPVVQEVTKKAVGEAVRYHQDKMKLEVAEVLQDEVSYRLSRYEKRRRKRDIKEKIGAITKGVVVVLVVLFILGNAQLRLRFALVFKDLGDMFVSLMHGEDTSSNKLVEDMFRDLGNELNDVNTIQADDKGFSIDNQEEITEENEEVQVNE